MPLAVLDRFLDATPGVCGGKPRIAGHRITVQSVALWSRLGQSPDEIADGYDLPLASVYAALAYYHDHRAEIDAEIAASDAFVAEVRRETPSPLAEKLARRG